MEKLQSIIDDSKRIVFFGGAGVSTESGIPDFRSSTGLYNQGEQKYSPEDMLHHDFFFTHTKEFYEFYFSKMIYTDAKPNDAHIALAKLESECKLTAIITQNIDGLHQSAGSKNVIELHGSVLRNYCISCGEFYSLEYMLSFKPSVPLCGKCGGIIKPDVVLYGESLDENSVSKAVSHISQADTLIIGGTSLSVYPAAGLIQYFQGSHMVLINKSETAFDNKADLVLHESIGKALARNS